MNRITASRLDLVAACPGAAVLPWQRSVSAASQAGTDGHAYLERAIGGDHEGAAELVPAHLRERMGAVDLEALRDLFPTQPDCEVPLAYSPETGNARYLPTKGPRDYSHAHSNEIPGTVDALAIHDDAAVCLDWKFGHSFVPPPERNLQVKFAALALARTDRIGPAAVTGAIVKIDEDGAARVYSHTWDEMGLDAIAAEIRHVWDRVRKQDPEKPHLVTSDLCRWCPARWSCPAIANQAQALIPLEARKNALTPEVAREAWVTLKLVKPMVEAMEDVLRGYAAEHGIPLGNGKVVRPVEVKRESVILASALEQSEEAGIDPADVLAAASLTKEALARQLGKEDAARLIEAVRQAGGIRTNHSQSLRETRES